MNKLYVNFRAKLQDYYTFIVIFASKRMKKPDLLSHIEIAKYLNPEYHSEEEVCQ